MTRTVRINVTTLRYRRRYPMSLPPETIQVQRHAWRHVVRCYRRARAGGAAENDLRALILFTLDAAAEALT